MKKIFVVMTRDIPCAYGSIINECALFSTKENAQQHFRNVVDSYRNEIVDNYLSNNKVGFDEETSEDYVLIENDSSFLFYKQDYFEDCHFSVWIEQKIIDEKA